MGGTAQKLVAFAFAGYQLPATNHFGVFSVLTVNRPNPKKSALNFSVQDATAALPQNCQTTRWIVERGPEPVNVTEVT